MGPLAENRLQDVSVALTRMETRRYIFRESSQEKKPELLEIHNLVTERHGHVKQAVCVSGSGTQSLTLQTKDVCHVFLQ